MNVYDGDWLDDMQHGVGTFTEVSSSFGNNRKGVYKGEWQNGQRTGKGKYTYASGMIHDGIFVNDEAKGQGQRTWTNGSYFIGTISTVSTGGIAYLSITSYHIPSYLLTHITCLLSSITRTTYSHHTYCHVTIYLFMYCH